jgi:hypothetical protein
MLYLLLLPSQGLLPDPLDLLLDLRETGAAGTALARGTQPRVGIILFVTFLWEICCVGGPSGRRGQLLMALGKPPKCLVVIITHVQQLVGGHPLMLEPATTLDVSSWIELICQ